MIHEQDTHIWTYFAIGDFESVRTSTVVAFQVLPSGSVNRTLEMLNPAYLNRSTVPGFILALVRVFSPIL